MKKYLLNSLDEVTLSSTASIAADLSQCFYYYSWKHLSCLCSLRPTHTAYLCLLLTDKEFISVEELWSTLNGSSLLHTVWRGQRDNLDKASKKVRSCDNNQWVMCVFWLMPGVLQLQPSQCLQDRPWDPQGGGQRAVQTDPACGEAGAWTRPCRHRPPQTADVSTWLDIRPLQQLLIIILILRGTVNLPLFTHAAHWWKVFFEEVLNLSNLTSVFSIFFLWSCGLCILPCFVAVPNNHTTSAVFCFKASENVSKLYICVSKSISAFQYKSLNLWPRTHHKKLLSSLLMPQKVWQCS